MKDNTKTAIEGKEPIRIFSTEFKQAKVAEIEAKIVSVAGVSKEYRVSRTAIYKWIALYSQRSKAIRTVVELDSEQHKTELLRERLAEVEAALGRKQLEVEFLNAVIEVGSDELKIDLKKNFGTRHLISSQHGGSR